MPICPCGRELAEKDRMGKSSWACPACGRIVKEGGAAEPRSSTGSGSLAARAAERPEQAYLPPRFAIPTLLCAALGPTVAGGALLVLRSQLPPLGWTIALICLLGGSLAGMAGILKLLGEAVAPSPRDRSAPERTLKIFLRSIVERRWTTAWTCLSWVARDESAVVRPAVEPLEIPAESLTVRAVEDLRRYWASLCGGISTMRHLIWQVREVRIDGNTAEGIVDFELTMDTRALSVAKAVAARLELRHSITVTFCAKFPLYLRDGRWYLLAGTLPPETRIVEV